MTWGIPTSAFLQLHVVLSLVGIVTGFIAVLGMVRGRYLPFWTAAFLLTTCLTGLTGFPLPPFGLDPPRIVGIILISALAGAATCLYGMLTLNVLLSFAQFERKVASERIRDKVAASKKKGIWVGGPFPLGYAMEDGKIAVVPEEAERVRHICTRYLELGSVRCPNSEPQGPQRCQQEARIQNGSDTGRRAVRLWSLVLPAA